jgi:TRAP transporter 4TM/12TM fusion protein
MVKFDADKLAELERRYDPELQFRSLAFPATWIVSAMLISLSIFHYYTAGYGILREATHRGIHLSLVLSLIFLVFSFHRGHKPIGPTIGNIPIYDWFFAILAISSAFYMPLYFDDLTFRIGNPSNLDLFFGTCMIVVVLEATRRSMGMALPIIVMIFIIYGLYGQYAPGVFAHPGSNWSNLVNHLYLTSQGIYGVPVGVVATYVFHFVLFGVLANRIGAGQLFMNIATAVAGRFRGGPAKISIFSSALFGMISGSSIANTVTTGSLTIPAMKKAGYEPHFAAAVEATASTGGQITPPIMGAAAFLMVEFLEIPYKDIILAAMVPALMHYLGTLTMVHFEAKKLKLKPVPKNEIPRFRDVIIKEWDAMIPLIILIGIIVAGYTPFKAAFWGITACIVVGFLKSQNRLTFRSLMECLELGAKYALAVGAAAAAVGIVIGIVTLTGMGFRVANMVTSLASDVGAFFVNIVPFFEVALSSYKLFFTLIFTAITCIILGAGIPTTATYIILVTIAAPALGLLGVEPLVAHFFVFYYGVLADITPPVALAAYAGAGIAKANPFKTGNTAFKLASAKALVPFVFIYSPSMLLVTKDFNWEAFFVTIITCSIGIILLGASLVGHAFVNLPPLIRITTFIAALGLIFPTHFGLMVAVIFIIPFCIQQYILSSKNKINRHQNSS